MLSSRKFTSCSFVKAPIPDVEVLELPLFADLGGQPLVVLIVHLHMVVIGNVY